MITQSPVTKGKQDWNTLGRGLPSTAFIRDPEVKRFLDAAVQNVRYCLLKVQDIRESPGEPEDITKRTKILKPAVPEAVMISATWDEATSADLVGAVNPHEHETTYVFQYMHVHYDMTTDSYPESDFLTPGYLESEEFDAGDGNVNVDALTTLTSLDTTARYYVRIKAWNEVGTVYSNVLAVDTCKNPEVTVDEAILVSASGVTLSGTVNPHGLETFVHFVYATSPKATGESTAIVNIGSGTSPVDVSATVTGLDHHSQYYFWIVAENTCGLTDCNDNGKEQFCSGGYISEIKSFWTLNLYAPVVENFGASNVTETTARLTGSVNPVGKETTWSFPYGPTHGLATYGLVTVDTILSPTATPSGNAGAGYEAVDLIVDIAGLIPGVQYYCQVIGTNADGTAYSDIQGFTPPLPILGLSGSLNFGQWLTGTTGTATRTVTITNEGGSGSTLNWIASIAMDAPFSGTISMSPSSGALTSGQSENITVTVTKDTVSVGAYTGTFTASAIYCTDVEIPAEVEVFPLYNGQLKVISTYVCEQGGSGGPQTNYATMVNSTGSTLTVGGLYFGINKLTAEEKGLPIGTYVARYQDKVFWNVENTCIDEAGFTSGTGCPAGTMVRHHYEWYPGHPLYAYYTYTVVYGPP